MQEFFSYYIRQQTILADVTVGCQSNGRRVSSIFDILAPVAKATPAGPPTPASHGRRAAAQASAPPTTPNASQGIPLLTHTPCYSAAMASSHRSRTSEPSYSSPCGHPLPRLPQLCVVPFLGLAVVHRPGALSAVGSTWSRNDFHRKSTVPGEAGSWVHGRSKEVPPYYAENNYSST